ncbi:MAG: LSM domain-containing protein [Candidatus Methanomethylicia archaeon]
MYEENNREKFVRKIMKLKNVLVKIQLVDGNTITGKLIGMDPDYLNLIIEKPSGEEDDTNEYMLIPGSSISYIKWVKNKGKKKDLERNVMKLLEREPNLTKEDLARILNTDLRSIEKVMRDLKRKGFINNPQNGKN